MHHVILTSKAFPTTIYINGKERQVIKFSCYSKDIKVQGKRKPSVNWQFEAFSIVAWAWFRKNDLYPQKQILATIEEHKDLQENQRWITDISEIPLKTEIYNLLPFEELQF